MLTREPAEEDTQYGDELVLAIQRALRDAGYYAGNLDGIAGPDTIAAIRTFEARNGLPAAGASEAELLHAVRSAADAGESPATTFDQGEPEAAEPDPMVAAVQGALARSAYGPLRADGIFGPQTREAIMLFQRDHDLPVTGEITDALVVELRASGALENE
jgi:peptidoglycan hydrolase-like protein with peptidoglycan-binding domain